MSAPRPDGAAAEPTDDELVSATSFDGSVAIRTLIATQLVAEAALRHDAAPTAADAFGRTLMGAVLLASMKKGNETVQVQFRGDGPLGTVMAIADPQGRVRGVVERPHIDPPLRAGRHDVAAAVGRGVLAVVRHRPGWREPYSGLVPIETGEVARDLTQYLLDSEQTHSAVGLGVSIDRDGCVTAAGGFLVQALPGASDEVLEQIEANVQALPGSAELVQSGVRGDELADRLLVGVGSSVHERSEPRFHCPCTRERARATIALLGRDEVHEIVRNGESQEVRCEFCCERYVLTPDELGSIFPDS